MSDEIKELEQSLENGVLTQGQAWNFIKFAQGMYSTFGGYNTPQLANQTLVQLNNNSSVPTFDKILQALQSAPYNVSELQNYSEFMQVWDAIYQKTLRHFRGLLSFDYYMVCNNATKEDYKKKDYQEDKRRAEKFMYSFNYKKEFDRVIAELVRNGVCYSWFRTNYGTFNDEELSSSEDIEIKRQNKFSLQVMPQKYCMLTGYWQGGLNYDFNMQYFLKSGVDIKEYDPSLMKRFIDLYYNGDTEKYSSSAQLYDRDGSFAQWTQVSSQDGAWAWLFDDSNFSGLPPFANLMKSVFNNDMIESLQRDKNVLSALALIMGEMELMDAQKGAQKSDQFAVSPEVLSQLLGYVKSALNSSVKQIPLPLKETKYAQYSDNSPMMAMYQYQMASSLGASASSMIYTNDKMAQFEMQSALMEDYNLMKRLYLQFADFINYFLNRKTKKYKFTVVFDGSNMPFERETRRKSIGELADRGLSLPPSFWASTYGYPAHMFERALEEAHYGEMTEKLTLLLNSNTSKNGGEVGNPKSDESEISDNGSISRDYE